MNTKALAINIKKEVKTLKMILYSMIIGIVIFSLVSLTVKRFINPLVIDNQRQGNLFLIVFFTVVIALSVLRYYFSRSIKKLTASSQSESEKFIAYRSASIIFFSVSELIALVGVIAFYY